MPRSASSHAFTLILAATALTLAAGAVLAQRGGPGGAGGPLGGGQTARGTPVTPEAVSLPDRFEVVTGPGPMFDSAPSHSPGYTPDDFGYRTIEYFVSGTAAGEPYNTRLVIRRPGDDADFSGLVLAESMHSSGAAHAFEYTSLYTMDAGHAAVEILTTSPEQFVAFNAERYDELVVPEGQANEILAQVGALVKSDEGPMGDLDIRKMVLGGTSMSAGTLINYLAVHPRYRTPDMQHIYDGYLPTSNGSNIPRIDVPVVHIPTMHEVDSNVTRRDDGDEPGDQYRLYEFSGIGHVDSRDNVRLLPNPCVNPLSTYPTQAYFAVGLHHLMRWVDEGVVPPKADRIWLDRNIGNDGSQMVLDEHGNPVGGIRNPYVDVPVASYTPRNVAADPLPAEVSDYVRANPGFGANIMCTLSAWQQPFSTDKLEDLYGNTRAYRRAFEASLDELEAEGWSLPVYRSMMLADAAAIEF